MDIIKAAIVALIEALFGKKTTTPENTQAVAVANKSGKLSADEARATRADTNKELSENERETDASVAGVHNASSLRDGQIALDRQIASANAHTGTDR